MLDGISLAVKFNAYGGPEVLHLADVDEPKAGPGEVRVRVKVAGVQPIDVKVRRGDMAGRMPVEFPASLGDEYAGVVDQIGEGVDGFAVGDEVLGSAGSVAYAEYVVAYGPGLADRVRGLAPQGVTVALDAIGGEEAIDTVADPVTAGRYGGRGVFAPRSPQRLAAVVELAAAGKLVMPVRPYPFAAVVEAHRCVESGHGRGKVVLML